ncbi:unnamed protein product [Rhizoctonia solani]|uniref:Uncharacterized protein n=1 Tax=Rhizoctonia solani TaxID=456999 RepID=A0A8H3CYN3_9AGAM|nr:unnamed protein product [Rhizoctonia solani]
MPSIWLTSPENQGKFEQTVPYLLPPFQPTIGTHTMFKPIYTQRKFITSSPIWDALLGSKPRYKIINLYGGSSTDAPASQLLTNEVMNSMNVSTRQALSAGTILWPPSYLEYSLQTAQSNIQFGSRGPDNLCEISEEYRIGNAFDIFASVGGLLALFQGLHVLLFGRPLFWGLFGAKLISPFGLFGKCTGDREFRRRLRERYYRPTAGSHPSNNDHQISDEEDINMNRFLLDFVIDMGPASVPIEQTSRDRSESETEHSGSTSPGPGNGEMLSAELYLLPGYDASEERLKKAEAV